MTLYDPNNPQHQAYAENFTSGVYAAKQPEAQSRRLAALAARLRAKSLPKQEPR